MEDLFLSSSNHSTSPSLPFINNQFQIFNIMLVSIFFTTIFLTVNHYSTLALLLVSKDDVAVGQSPNLTHALAKRLYVPPDQLCTHPDNWDARDCLSLQHDQVWLEHCLDKKHEPYLKLGICLGDTMCMNAYSPAPDFADTVMCVVCPQKNTGNPNIHGQNSPTARQCGVYLVNKVFFSSP